jgi:protein-disulfide isomerase
MTRDQWLVPIAIIVAGAIIAVAVYFINKDKPATPSGQTAANVRPYDPAQDHILGNPNAPIKIIEYSDMECPHCKTYAVTLKDLIGEYGPTGEVAWVYRHFPIAELHSKAPKESEAAECAAEVGGGDEAFFKFVDRVYEITPSNNGLDLGALPDIAAGVGLDREKFKACLDSGKYKAKIDSQVAEALALGIRGTPMSYISVAGNMLPVEGAQSLSAMRSAINAILDELKRGAPTATPSQ